MMKTESENILRKHWLLLFILLITIAAAVWTFTGYSNLILAYQTFTTPAAIVFPKSTPILSYQTPITNPSVVELETSTPIPGNFPPKIPDGLQDFLGEALHPVFIKGEGWRLIDLLGKLYYFWDESSSEWLAYPEVNRQYCNIPLISSVKIEAWDSICYLDFSGLGVTLDEGTTSSIIIGKDDQGKLQISEQAITLYQLNLDPLYGYQWIETPAGYVKRIAEASKLISEVDPQIHIGEIEIPKYVSPETYFTDTSLYARYLGSVDHQIISGDGKDLGSVKLHLFARNPDVQFWISGEGRVLGILTGIPFLTRYAQLRIDLVEYMLDSPVTLVQNNRYEFFFIASQHVILNEDIGQIDLSTIDVVNMGRNYLKLTQVWMTKQLLLMKYIYDHGSSWMPQASSEFLTSPPSLVPFYYIKKP